MKHTHTSGSPDSRIKGKVRLKELEQKSDFCPFCEKNIGTKPHHCKAKISFNRDIGYLYVDNKLVGHATDLHRGKKYTTISFIRGKIKR